MEKNHPQNANNKYTQEELLQIINDLQKTQQHLQDQLEQMEQRVQGIDPYGHIDWSTYDQEQEKHAVSGYHDFPEEDNKNLEDHFPIDKDKSSNFSEPSFNEQPNYSEHYTEDDRDEDEEDGEQDSEKPIWQHLEDLRWVIIKSLGTIAFFLIIGLIFNSFLQKIFRLPVERANFPEYDFLWERSWLPTGEATGSWYDFVTISITNSQKLIQINNDGVSSAFMASIKIGLIFGIVLSIPFLIYFIWTFVSPALKEKERYLIIRLAWISSFLFIIGICFGYSVILFGVPILANFAQEGTSNIWRYMDYISFCSMLMLTFGLIFELPIFLVGLIYAHLLSTKTLKKMRPYAIVIIFIIAALLTPPDPVSQLSMGVPLCILYQISIWVGAIYERKQQTSLEGE